MYTVLKCGCTISTYWVLYYRKEIVYFTRTRVSLFSVKVSGYTVLYSHTSCWKIWIPCVHSRKMHWHFSLQHTCWWYWLQRIIKHNMLMIATAMYIQEKCAADPGYNIYSSAIWWKFWLQGILKPNVLMILVGTYAQTQSADDSGYNVYSKKLCWWFWLQRIIKPCWWFLMQRIIKPSVLMILVARYN